MNPPVGSQPTGSKGEEVCWDGLFHRASSLCAEGVVGEAPEQSSLICMVNERKLVRSALGSPLSQVRPRKSAGGAL